MNGRALVASAAIVLGGAVLTGCAANSEEPPETAEPAQTSAPPVAPSITPSAPTKDQEPDTDAAPTCEDLITDGIRTQLIDVGWSYESEEMYFLGAPLTGSIMCVWGDYTIPSDDTLVYGWGKIDATTAQQAQAELVGEGWRREDATEGVYITADPRFSLGVDEEGYGMTYLFGDGWVTVADTKQGLALITRK